MYFGKALEFSSFPTLLLLTTMFRLAINVSVTRLILTTGDAGSVVKDFGQFVVGGNVVVGLVIFLILVVIQFVVVTNGAGRVAEVGARFTLDAMPGKQMAIDADLNAGLISDEQARNRRSEIAREADFYGAMDGASKFVKGDAMAAVIITAINLIGGIIVGVSSTTSPSAKPPITFSLLTVGDGLAAQIPALLISVATGIIVTRAVSDRDLGSDIAGQILSQRKAPLVAGGGDLHVRAGARPAEAAVHARSAGCFGAIGWAVRNGHARRATAAETAGGRADARGETREGRRRARAPGGRPARAGNRLRPGPARRQQLERRPAAPRVSMIRRQVAAELGIVIPPVRIHDELGVDSHEYVIRVRASEVARGRDHAGASARHSTPVTRPRGCRASRPPSRHSGCRPCGYTSPRARRPRRSATPSSTCSR